MFKYTLAVIGAFGFGFAAANLSEITHWMHRRQVNKILSEIDRL